MLSCLGRGVVQDLKESVRENGERHTLHGRPLIWMKPPFLRVPARCGVMRDISTNDANLRTLAVTQHHTARTLTMFTLQQAKEGLGG